MIDFSIDDILENLHPAIGQIDILYWHEIKKNKYSNIYFLGTDLDCALFQERFNIYKIDYAGTLIVSKDLEFCGIFDKYGNQNSHMELYPTIIVTMPDYPQDIFLYKRLQEILYTCGIKRPCIIHEFSAGFALGAELMAKDKTKIYEAYNNLLDENSKNCFYKMLKTVSIPYHWNMDLKEHNYGIRDPKRYSYKDEDDLFKQLEGDIKTEQFVLICCATELKKNDPIISYSLKHKKSMLFLPRSIARLRVREFFEQQMCQYTVPILGNILWNSCGNINISMMKYTGGTPLAYEKKKYNIDAVTIKAISDSLGNEKIGLISLDMGLEFKKAIDGGIDVIENDNPIVLIQGFKMINELWETIIWCHTRLVRYNISLFRYETDNVCEGHVVVLKPKGDKK